MNYRQIIDKGTLILKSYSIPNPAFDAELLLSISLKKSREKILLNLEKNINDDQINCYLNLIDRRKKKEPVSLIIGKKFFWGTEFYVNKNVLTPRYETELLVERVLKAYKNSDKINVLDIGVGSGCILISLLKEKMNWKGTGVDISKLAIKKAKTNAKIQQITNRINFLNSDIDNLTSKKYDLIVSNPPYINKIEYNNLNKDVKDYEPKVALYGGIEGTDIIKKVINFSKKFLKNNGLLGIETGYGQFYQVSEILRSNGFYISEVVKDYQKIKRCLLAKKIK